MKKPLPNETLAAYIMRDPTSWALFVINIIVVWWVIPRGWALEEVMKVYWAQSVIIGVFTFLEILSLKKFSTKGMKVNGSRVDPTTYTKYRSGIFFLLHYGMFHAAFGGVLFFGQEYGASPPGTNLYAITVLSVLFLINHAFSFSFHKHDHSEPNIGHIFIRPYARIIPMHLVIFTGMMASGSIWFFLILKVFADMLMHVRRHRES